MTFSTPPRQYPPGGFVHLFLLTEVLLTLFVPAAGFYVLLHAPAPLPGILPFFPAHLKPFLRLRQQFLLLYDNLIQLGDKRLPTLKPGNGDHTVLAAADLFPVFLLILLKVFDLLALGFMMLLGFRHFFQRGLFFPFLK
tara:strand:- start:83 stop:499 length:417 start_codon:yes stop_codon:yes gene_type:complete